jgi:hypothetical protein
MAPSAHRSSAQDAFGPYAQYGAYDYQTDAGAPDWDVAPGERIGPPPRRRYGKLVLLALVGLIGAAAWALATGRVAWPAWLPNDTAIITTWLQQNVMQERRERAAPAVSPPGEPMPKLATVEVPPEPARTRESLMPAPAEKSPAALTTGSLPPPAQTESGPGQPLPPVVADPSDPYQKRALAVGLHPGLSRVLLTRMSDADYKNAGAAIQKAITETPESGVLLWPQQRTPELALFRVSFVPGAASGCRRYVVAVTKDRWLTTALPMEKCGIEMRRQAQRK